MLVHDVAIVGGGLVGCSAALHLSLRGASVALIERGYCGAQASGVNFGGVRQQGRHLSELALARRSRRIWATLGALVGSDCEFVATGHLKLAFTTAQWAELETYRLQAAEHGLVLELISGQRLQRDYPWLGPSVVGASLCVEDGHANPRIVAPAFARTARKRGVLVREGVRVVGAHHTGHCFELELATGEVLKARTLINAAGAWALEIASWFGEQVPERVMSPNMCVTEPLPYVVGPSLGVCGGDIYVRQILRGNVIFGAGLGTGDRERARATPLADVTAEAARLALRLVPRLRGAQLIRSWSGIEGFMPDGLPVLGHSASRTHLIHAFGFSGHGFQLGPGVGAVLAELALDGATQTPIEPFDIRRFTEATQALTVGIRHEDTAE